ncbi:MAG: small multi-drug export protein [Eubacterium sp.]|nr:small multi-drug export protein [Eubacterium sp.]MEE3398522.1 small multi-drug export protein [Eubacterium sp.]
MMLKYFIVFFISMLPLAELRVAIPYAIGLGLNIPLTYVIAIIGNMLPVPFIFFFARRVLEWGTKVNWPKGLKWVGKFFNFCLEKGERGGKKLTEKVGRSSYIALFLFVGIPVPGTGAWVGTLAASILDLDFKKSVIAVVCGVILAGIIMGLGSAGVFTLIRGMF